MLMQCMSLHLEKHILPSNKHIEGPVAMCTTSYNEVYSKTQGNKATIQSMFYTTLILKLVLKVYATCTCYTHLRDWVRQRSIKVKYVLS